MLQDYRILFLFLIPIILNVVFFYRAHTHGRSWRSEFSDFNWWEAGISLVLFSLIMAGMWYTGRSARINNFSEQIGGFIINKYAVDGDHEESYDCNCTTDSNGNTSCSTCYRTVYHREFFVENNTGYWWNGWRQYDRVDKSCETCEPYHIPQFYTNAYIGKPVSLDHFYPNYIAAMNDDIYRNTYNGLAAALPDICPETSDIRANETSVYKAIPIGFEKDAPIRQAIYGWNFHNGDPSAYVNSGFQQDTIPLYMDTMFGYLGGAVQGDVHLYVMNTPVVEYANMCLAKWKNGAKNSIYVFIFGTSDGSSYSAKDVYVGVGVDGTTKNSELEFDNESERSNYYLKYDIRNELMTYFDNGGTLERENVLRIIFNNVSTKFVRQEMANFEALKDYVYPTNGFIWLMAIVLLIIDAIVHAYFANNDL